MKNLPNAVGPSGKLWRTPNVVFLLKKAGMLVKSHEPYGFIVISFDKKTNG
jgi:hypothetical protein